MHHTRRVWCIYTRYYIPNAIYCFYMFRLILSYFVWHYTQAFKDISNLFVNLVWFVYHFFSIKVLFKTLFNPWRKPRRVYENGQSAWALIGIFVDNLIMRVSGFCLRLIIIVWGIVLLGLIFIGWVLVVIGWVFLPFIITLLFVSGLRLLI